MLKLIAIAAAVILFASSAAFAGGNHGEGHRDHKAQHEAHHARHVAHHYHMVRMYLHQQRQEDVSETAINDYIFRKLIEGQKPYNRSMYGSRGRRIGRY